MLRPFLKTIPRIWVRDEDLVRQRQPSIPQIIFARWDGETVGPGILPDRNIIGTSLPPSKAKDKKFVKSAGKEGVLSWGSLVTHEGSLDTNGYSHKEPGPIRGTQNVLKKGIQSGVAADIIGDGIVAGGQADMSVIDRWGGKDDGHFFEVPGARVINTMAEKLDKDGRVNSLG